MTNLEWWQILLGLVTAFAGGSGLASIAVALLTKKKSRADALKIIEEAASAQVCRMREEVETWRRECFDLRKELAEVEQKMESFDMCQASMKDKMLKMEEELADLRRENRALKARIVELEKENWRLKNEE